MAVFIDPTTGEQYEVPAGQEEIASTQYGLVNAAEQAAQTQAEGANLQTVVEEAGRAVASGAAGAARALTPDTPEGLTELEPGQVDTVGSGRALAGTVGLGQLYSEEARQRREANPIAAGIGAGLPGAVLTAPLGLVGGIAAESALSGYLQEAVDAELESRDIDGSLILRNGALNAAWGGAAVGLGAGARAALRGGRNVLERAADTIRQARRGRAAAADGAELVDAVSDAATRDELTAALRERSEEAVEMAWRRLQDVRAPRVANNPQAQREALEATADAFEAASPALAGELRAILKGSPRQRFEALHELRQRLETEPLPGAGIADEPPISLAGRDIESLGALTDPRSMRPQSLEFLRASDEFAETGRVGGPDDPGIKIRHGDPEEPLDLYLVDGRHRLTVAREKGIPEVWGTVYDADGEEVFRGMIPLTERAAPAVDSGASEVARALDQILENPGLWGEQALGGHAALERALRMRPAPGAGPEELLEFASAVRGVREGEFAGIADQLEQLAERAGEVRAAAVLGDTAPKAARGAERVDYQRAMVELDPEEAWHLTRAGADEGLRRLEAATVSDAFQRVDDVLKQDVAMIVKRSDFESGAAKWSARQLEKQAAFAGRMFDKGAELLQFVSRSKGSNPDSGFALGGFAAQAERLLNTGLSRLAGADPITRNFELDQLKRGLDAITEGLSKSATIDQATKAAGVARIGELTNELRRGLESYELFGRNAGLQEATNAAWKRLIDPYSRVKKRMSEFLGREFANIGTESGNIIRFNPDMVERAMGSFDRNFRSDLQAAVKGIDQLVTARQAQGLSHLESLARARADLERIREGFEFADLLRVAKSKAKEPISEAAKRSIGKSAGSAVGAAAGSALGGSVGAVAGAAAGAVVGRFADDLAGAAVAGAGVLKPGSQSRFSGALRKHLGLARSEQSTLLSDPAFAEALPEPLKRQLMAAGEGANARAVKLGEEAKRAAETESKTTARLLLSPAAARRYVRAVGSFAAAVTRFQGEHDSPEQAFRAYRRMLDQWQREPGKLVELLEEEFGDIASMSPKLHREMTTQAARINDYLQRHMPGQRGRSVVYPDGSKPSRLEVRQFALRFTAATDPAGVLEDAKRGRLERAQLETLRELWPRDYNMLRADVLAQLGSGQVSPRARQRVALLFEFGSSVDPAFGARTRGIANRARAELERRQPQGAGGSRSTMPSAQTLQPGGLAALQLGQSLTF